MGVSYLDKGNDDGTCLGQSATAKIAFFGGTPAVQPSGASQAAVATSITTTATTTNIATQCAANSVLINKIRTDLVAQGFLKGSA